MTTKKLEKVIIVSDWRKDGKICHVRSEKKMVEGVICPHLAKVGTFTFTGYNPFPCYSMKSTFEVVSKWLYENGWEKEGSIYETYYNVLSDEILIRTEIEKRFFPAGMDS